MLFLFCVAMLLKFPVTSGLIRKLTGFYDNPLVNDKKGPLSFIGELGFYGIMGFSLADLWLWKLRYEFFLDK